jgi:hypothetical protein
MIADCILFSQGDENNLSSISSSTLLTHMICGDYHSLILDKTFLLPGDIHVYNYIFY